MTWTLLESAASPHRIFTRPLDGHEHGYYLESRLSGSADIVQQIVVQSHEPSLFSEPNVTRTWLALKQLFPLLGATVQEDSGTQNVRFLVSEARLRTIQLGEVGFGAFESAEAGLEYEQELNSGPRQISEDRLARVRVFSRVDHPEYFHVIFNHSHIIVDGMADMTLGRMFLDILALPPAYAIPDLETRLSLVIGTQNLNPKANTSIGKKRWRQAIAAVIFELRKAKMQVGDNHRIHS